MIVLITFGSFFSSTTGSLAFSAASSFGDLGAALASAGAASLAAGAASLAAGAASLAAGAASLAFSATQNNDKIGLILFTNQIELYIPPKKGRSHVLRIIRELIEFKPTNKKTNISEGLRFLSSVLKKRAIVFVLSDFMDDNYDYTLKIASKKHDITGIRIYDKNEMTIPSLGLVQMIDQESGKSMLVNTSLESTRKNYANHFIAQQKYFENSFKKSGAGHLSCRLDQSYVKKLLGYFKQRG